jgi:hypothetical protein
MHDAIQTLYREEPICKRQQRTIRPVAVPASTAEPAAWLASETARLEELERRLRRQTG